MLCTQSFGRSLIDMPQERRVYRYRLLDYLYTAFHKASVDGSPVVNPLWFKYPTDMATFGIDLQFIFGDSILVSPVTEESTTTVTIYLPKDKFYDFATFAPVEGTGQNITSTSLRSRYTSVAEQWSRSARLGR
jgi:alpha-glucosidase (family GH31 glycosyl hydrolase)